jgi:ribonuclease R
MSRKQFKKAPGGEKVTGVLERHRDGYGFVCPEGPSGEDVFIRPPALGGAWHGDQVLATIERTRQGGRREGRIVRILSRVNKTIVGRYEQRGRQVLAIPLDERFPDPIWLGREQRHQPQMGDIVTVEITQYPDGTKEAQGKILSILGDINNPDVEVAVVAHEHGLPMEFSPRALNEAEAIPDTISETEIQGRKDLRSIPSVTIDGENARDFDDAVAVQKDGDNIRLWVSIADVSHYVRPETALDEEAYQRGTSVYFPDRAIHMLPTPLSTGICSLKPDVDRLTMTAEMLFDAKGGVANYQIYPSVIHSHARMTYTDVRKILVDKDPETRSRYHNLIPHFELMESLFTRLRARRVERGSIDFDLPEPEILLDIEGKPENIIRAERNVAHRIIEEFMLAANETVAWHMSRLGLPFLYRVHEEPDPLKVKNFSLFLGAIGIQIDLKGTKKLEPKLFQKIVSSVEGKPFERTVNLLMLRTMKQARYSEENSGHFGLAAQYYAHFTSPIRRYPDLIVHRLLREVFHSSRMDGKKKEYWKGQLPEIAKHTSRRERVAVEAEREIVDLKKVQFMVDKLGEVYPGYVSGVVSFGIFVELNDLFVEGLAHISTLPNDRYHFVEEHQVLKGHRTGKTFRLGDPVRVQVARVDVARRRIDFELVQTQ